MSSDNSDNSPGRGVFTPLRGNSPGRGTFSPGPGRGNSSGNGAFSPGPGRGNSPGRGRGTTSQSHHNYGRGYGSPGRHTSGRGFTSPGRQTHINGIAQISHGRGRGYVTLDQHIFNQQGQQSHGRGFVTPNQHTSNRGFVGHAHVPPSQQFGRGYGQQADSRRFGVGRGTNTNIKQDSSQLATGRGKAKSKMNWGGGGREVGAVGRGGARRGGGGKLWYDGGGGSNQGHNSSAQMKEHRYYQTQFLPPSIAEWIPKEHNEPELTSYEEIFCDRLKANATKNKNFRQELDRILSDCTNPRLTVLKIIRNCRGVRAIVVDFEKWLKARPGRDYPELTPEHTDLAVKSFLTEDKVTNISAAIQVFHIDADIYGGIVPHLCQLGKYKFACDWATSLQLFDKFPISDFVLPLLVQGKLNTLEFYLDESPKSTEQFVLFLDALITNNSLLTPYLTIPNRDGLNQLFGKTLDKIIRRYCSKFDIDTESLPNYSMRLNTNDLIYWTREYRNIENSGITAWRELMESKLDKIPHMKSTFLDLLVKEDTEETIFWSKQLGIKTANTEFLFSQMSVRDEEDWLDDNSSISTRVTVQQNISITATTTNNATIGARDDTLSDAAIESRYFSYPLPWENLKFIDTAEEALDCFKQLSKVPMIGLDGEFTAGPHRVRLSTLQLSTLQQSYILDMTSLVGKMEPEDWMHLTNIINHPDISILGFGVVEDLILLSKSSPTLQPIVQSMKGVICLEKLKSQLFSLLGYRPSQLKGLSGFTESVLGKGLDKSEQISNWDRRPLRREQMIYAAMDAYVVLALYTSIQATAQETGKYDKFDQIITDFKAGKKPSQKTKKDEKNKEVLKEQVFLGPLNKEAIKPRDLHVVCDTMLQGVCKKLRVCGVDAVALDNIQSHDHCLYLREEQIKRGIQPVYILSRGKPAQKISKGVPHGHCYSVVEESLDAQLQEIFKYFNVVADEGDLFSRCVICNGDHYIKLDSSQLKHIRSNIEKTKYIPAGAESNKRNKSYQRNQDFGDFLDDSSDEEDQLVPPPEPIREWVEAEGGGKYDVKTGVMMENNVQIGVNSVPPNSLENNQEFWICTSCGKVYWQGSHWEKAQDRVKHFLNTSPSPVPSPKQ